MQEHKSRKAELEKLTVTFYRRNPDGVQWAAEASCVVAYLQQTLQGIKGHQDMG